MRKRIPDENYKLNRMDFLIIQLVHQHDYEFLEEVLESFSVMDYDTLPKMVADQVADVLEERLMEIGEEEVLA
jgi:hypothetical protein